MLAALPIFLTGLWGWQGEKGDNMGGEGRKSGGKEKGMKGGNRSRTFYFPTLSGLPNISKIQMNATYCNIHGWSLIV